MQINIDEETGKFLQNYAEKNNIKIDDAAIMLLKEAEKYELEDEYFLQLAVKREAENNPTISLEELGKELGLQD